MSKAKIAATSLAAMVAIATPIYTSWEGTKNMPYRDIVGKWTVCSGDTRNVVPNQRLTDAQCDERTRKILVEYGTKVAELSPGIEDSQYEWAAHSIFSANVGTGAYAKSSIRRLYNTKDYVGACRSILLYDKAGGRVVIGLKNRRAGKAERLGEYELCLAGAVPKRLSLT